MAVNHTMILCDGLVKIYKVQDLEVVALQGLDLVVERGEFMAIVGPSGSGKSSLLNILGGLDRPTAGKAIVDGLDLLRLSNAELTKYRREKVGFLWQQPSRNLVPYLSVWDNVELPMLLTGQPAQERRDWVQELLEAVGLWDRRTHSVHQLSGGEQQRTAIAVALANKPILLLADEPTGEVDSVTAQQIFATIHNLNQTYDLTVVVVTHDVRISDQVDRVVSIRDGKTSSERFRRVYESAEETIYGEGAIAGEESLDQGVSYHEYVVVDAAGRLQIPKEFIEELGIRGLVELERVDGGILVKPAKDAEHLSTHAERAAAAMDQWSNADESPLGSNAVVRAGQQIWQAITRRK